MCGTVGVSSVFVHFVLLPEMQTQRGFLGSFHFHDQDHINILCLILFTSLRTSNHPPILRRNTLSHSHLVTKALVGALQHTSPATTSIHYRKSHLASSDCHNLNLAAGL